MDVGIITIHNHLNYGAVLQAFALNSTIRRLGHPCKTIDCNIDPGTGRLITWRQHPGRQITNLYLLYHRRADRRFQQRFLDFGKQYIPMTDTTYATLRQLVVTPPRFDAYITGSDQVWRPHLLDREIGDAFHLCFARPEQSRLISYAPSFGVNEIPKRHVQKIRRYMAQYHALSVREKQGQEIISALFDRKAEHVLDPTLLMSAEQYEPICSPPSFSGEFILAYPMELGKDREFLNLVQLVRKCLRLPVVCVLPLNFDFRWLLIANKVVLDAGPKEFLGFFKAASFICTNSFHGTAFSIVYRKNFLGVPHSISNSRIYSLLEKVGLIDRQVTDICPLKIKERLERPIDYSTVAPRLQYSIARSLGFLEDALGT